MRALVRCSQIVVSVAALCASNALPAQKPGARPTTQAVTERMVVGTTGAKLDRYLGRLAPFGYSGNALVAQGGKILLAKGYGVADRARQLPFSATTVIPIGSLVKPFTMLAILQLAQDGKLRTTDSLFRFFPEIPTDKRNITVDQLLVHTAGFPLDVGTGDRNALSRGEFLDRLFAAPLLFPPGSGNEYSNAGYSLLARIVEQLAGTDFETAVRQRILTPAGMTHTGWRDPRWSASTIAHVYMPDGGDFGTMLDVAKADDGGINWNQRGNGGWLSTAEDLYRWHRAMNSGLLLNSAGRRKHEWTALRRVGLAGGNGAFETAIEYDANRDLFVVVHNNVNGPLATPIAQSLARLAVGDSVAMPPAVVPTDGAALARVIGRYTMPSGGRLTIDTAGGALVVSAEGQDAIDAVTGASPATRAERDAITAYTDTVVRAWRAGDWHPLHAAFGAAAPLEEFVRRQSAMRARIDARLGSITGYTVLGTRRQGQAMMTRVRIDHERGRVFENYGWAGRSVVLFGFQDDAPRDRFLPESAASFVNVDPRNGAVVRLTLRGDGALVVESGAVRAIATRES